jgi:alpha-L-rhamnosidase
MNHIMFGEINAWYYKALGGIFPDEERPGFKNVVLKPHFVPGLDHFEAKHEGPYGPIVSSWKKKGKTVEYNISVPSNSTATLYLAGDNIREKGESPEKNKFIKTLEKEDGKFVYELQSGDYQFSIR